MKTKYLILILGLLVATVAALFVMQGKGINKREPQTDDDLSSRALRD